MLSTIAAMLFLLAGIPPSTPITQSMCSGFFNRPMSTSGWRLPMWPMSKHSCSGLIPFAFSAVSSSIISSKEFSKTVLKTNSLRDFEYFA